ncbi:MAG: hypothetical protein NTY19_22960 [Planctomycetota bacterium]|nr:hypothetical protein [Planctomycetota bacterium]
MRIFGSQTVAPRPAVEPRTATSRAAELQLRTGLISAAFGAVVLLAATARAADTWTDISTPLIESLKSQGHKLAWPGGCSGVVVDRLTGAVVVKVVGGGLWRNTDKGTTWQRIDEGTISGRDETGWATSVDQDDPQRMASFSLDGLAAWTTDGKNWKSFTNNGRNWDFGSVDWSAAAPKTIIVARHETSPPGEVDLSTDSGVTWNKLAINLNENRNQVSMVGALDATTLIYSNGQGIQRSTDTGVTWAQVSEANPLTRIPVLFRGVHYLGTADGLLVSKDKGAIWQPQGAAVKIQLGPFFGADANTMVVVGNDGAHRTTDAGKTWTCVARLKSAQGGYSFETNWFGCYAWDPMHNILYAAAMGNPAFKLELGTSAEANEPSRGANR